MTINTVAFLTRPVSRTCTDDTEGAIKAYLKKRQDKSLSMLFQKIRFTTINNLMYCYTFLEIT